MNELRENKEINELLEILEENGMIKEKTEVSALVDYIGEMEKTLSAMLSEMQEMRKEVNLIHDNTLRHKCGLLVQSADNKIRQGIAVIIKAKENFVISAKGALNAFKEKGKEALKDAVRKMKIPETLDRVGDFFHKLSESLRGSVENIKSAREEYLASKHHKTNARLLLFGKKPGEPQTVKNDKGILAKMENFFGKLARGFTSIENKANDLADKIRVDRVKSSVKADLDFLNSEAGKSMPPPNKDVSR